MPPAVAPSDFRTPEATYCGPLYAHSFSLPQSIKETGYPNLLNTGYVWLNLVQDEEQGT